LNILLKSVPLLRIVDSDQDFVVCTNTCKEALGGVIFQNGNVVWYESRNLKEHQRLYATHDLQLIAIVHALNMW
jgi:hypothetical protein